MTAPKKTTKPADEVYDFDGWDEAAEEAAIAEAARQTAIRYIIVDDKFVGRFPDGRIVKVPISVSLADIESIAEQSDGDIDQVKKLVKLFGEERDAGILEQENILSVTDFTKKYFAVFNKISGASLGD